MEITPNTKYKDSLFSLMFKDPTVLRELYCALKGVVLPKDVPIIINTLENVFFMALTNDISFEIGGNLVVLIEHQSTINPNMALRLLMYAGRVYEKIVEGSRIYSAKLVRIPRPEFYVLYNGLEPYPEKSELRLSSAYRAAESLGLPAESSPSLELVISVMNINQGMNEGLASGCRALADYSAFIAKARGYQKSGKSRMAAIRAAIKYCQKNDIMKDFLKKHATEVIGMLMTEWRLSDAIKVSREEAWEEGREEGMEKGREEGMEKGLEKGLEKGMEEGIYFTARNALAKGASVDFVMSITGLDEETVKSIKESL